MTLSTLLAGTPSDPALQTRADAVAHSLATEALNDGPWQFYYATKLTTPGLYWGIAGIGYSLLHYACGTQIPNFLMVQPAV